MARKPTEWLTQKEAAKRLSVTQQAVAQAVRVGRLQVVRCPSGSLKLPWPQIEAQWKANTRRRTGDQGELGETNTLFDSQAKKEAYNAKLKELEYKEKSGELVRRDEVEKEAFALARSTRDAILNVPNRIADELAAESDRFKVHQRLNEELVKALEDLASKQDEIGDDDE